MDFRHLFFKYYDRGIMNGDFTFFETHLGKMEFTNLCTNQDYLLEDRDKVLHLAELFKLDEDQAREFVEAAGFEY